MTRLLLIVGFSTLLSGTALAADTLQPGISREEAKRLLGPSVIMGKVADGTYSEIFMAGERSAFICGDVVVAVSEDYPGGFHTFSEMVEDERVKRGPGQTAITNYRTAVGEVSRIAVTWEIGNEHWSLSLTQTEKEQPSVTFIHLRLDLCAL